MVPHLTTALNGPLLDLEKSMLEAMPNIEHWFRTQWLEYAAPFYASVDLRNAGFKLAPVDTNLFPAGFNNLNPDFLHLSVQAAMVAIEKICPEAHRLLIIPENHTRNTYYLRNVLELANILKQAGMEVRIGSISPEITTPTKLETHDGQYLLLEPVVRVGNRIKLQSFESNELSLKEFDSCAILLNNDLSGGIPEILKNLEQDLIPPLYAGWSTRRKSQHFAAYNRVAADFSALLGIDEWLINPYFDTCGDIDFNARTGEDCLAIKVEQLLAKIKIKYAQYGVTQAPFVIVKANAGTYGMGIMTVKSPDDVRGLNRKTRNKMSVVKEGLEVTEVIIQEGVYTFESINEAVAEPVVYMMDHFVIGGFYRVHTGRAIDENLNAPGSHFVPLAFEKPCTLPDCAGAPDATPNRFYAYGVVARLALLAAAIELQEQDPLNR
ncbi:MAG: glutamate--cysteine ligase [Methylotenera sp.]|nr:glutamate--cysteine ligase [Methylotenera sp.]MDO9233944.1 glutamate--cysteine ligase [Methylotenera sp.]MDO9388874.1 glutamate--cysteine ligase [Methylotenera sp.]MDP2102696.1 glutamate--cysteine ligase [Methylotenera sp.]MDP2282336.1 glutamate--cysteine ligase [Methylotenera sp.]